MSGKVLNIVVIMRSFSYIRTITDGEKVEVINGARIDEVESALKSNM
jgi:hypothetical protein